MNRTAALLLGAMILLAAGADGFNDGRGRCLCPGSGAAASVQSRLVKTIEVFKKTAGCDRIEVIAEMKKSGKKKCLDWNSTKVKKLVNQFLKKRAHQKTQKKSKA